MNQRALALDALRGYAIITMVLSATIISSILPGWMSHAQTPPPEHIFNPEIPGITWVDLVFPFFLFAMGAAFPFSIGRHAEKGRSKLMLCYDAIKRGIQLTFFAIFIQHFYPYVISSPQDLRSWLLAITCGKFYQFNLSSCIRQQNSLTAQFVSFSLSNLANIFYPPQFLQ